MKVINLSLNLILIKLYISIFKLDSVIRYHKIYIAFQLVFKLFHIKKCGASIAYFSILEHNNVDEQHEEKKFLARNAINKRYITLESK